MASKSTSISSEDTSSQYQIPSHQGTISTSIGKRSAKTLSTVSKCFIVAFVVGGVAGIVIIGLGAANIFGPIGSPGCIGSIAGGGTVTVFSIGGITIGGIIVIANCKTKQGRSRLTRDENHTIETRSNLDRVPLKDKMGETYSEMGQEAIEFARQKLNENSDSQPFTFKSLQGASKGGTHQPLNQEIALLTTLYYDVYFEAFTQEVKKHADPWSQPAVIQAADDLIKIGYAITCLTLEDLPEFTQDLESKGTKRTYAEALAKQDSYQYRTYYYCTQAYHWIRGGSTWSQCPWDDEEGEDLYQPSETPKEHADLFYQKGTIQYGWRMLYNDHCDRIRSYVKEADLKEADNRLFTWTKKDEDTFKGRTFSQIPDTLPT